MAATPDFACTPKLEKLFLDDCIVLNEIHESICHLTNLTNWSMRNCQSLEKLPQECLGDLPKLVELNLQGCQRLQSLPDFACTPNLEKLFLDDCNNLNEIHESICHLNKLTNWSMRNCGSLEKLPQKHLGDLPKLVELNLQGCQQLQSLPRLPSSLRKLFLQECKMLIVAHGFENLESIELLEMDGCEGINSTLMMTKLFQIWLSDIKALTVTEDFGTYLYSYENENQREIVEDWKKALEVVDQCRHHFIYHTDWYMHELTSRICDRISSMLKFNMSRFRIPHTWLCSRGKQEAMILMDLEKETDSVCRIGICGPNGIGKTTIAKIIYDTLFHKFEFGGFITDVGPNIRTSKGLMSLQQKLLNVVARDGNACIQTADHGKDLIKQRLGHKRVLIVFDDVDELDDRESQYIFASELFGGGSKIIVIAKAIEKPDLKITSLDAIYYVDKLTDKKSFQLFAWHAFKGRQPTLELMELAREATKFAEGVPLCLVVLGSLFSSMTTKSEWGTILKKLAAAPGNECIDKIVKVSIDTLDTEQRQVLFDIACLKKHTTCVWKQHRYSPNNIIKFLEGRCLISLDTEKMPMIYDGIQDSSQGWLAQEVCNWPRPKSIGGLTGQNPHIRNVFLDIACCLVGSEKEYAAYVWEDMGYSPDNAIRVLQDMYLVSIDKEGRLQMNDFVRDVGRLMAKEGEHNPYTYITMWNGGGLSDPLREARRPQNKELRWLQLKNAVDKWVWADATSYSKKLLVLQLHYCKMRIRRRLGRSNKVFKKLKVLEVLNHDEYGTGFFDLSCMPSLVKLVIEDRYILKTEDLVMRIGELTNLKYLAITNCYRLEKLCGRIGKLSSLQTLDLQECPNLSELPKDLGDLKALRELILHNCLSLLEIPNSIIKLDHLQTLDVSYCKSLEHMPQLPSHLITLDASSCWSLGTIADISNLQDLKTLKLHGCAQLRNVPGLQNLKSLQSMQLPFEMASSEEEICSDFEG